MEVIPLVMEPFSGFYDDPVLVLDYQSLYPSMMIAYNLCPSTCFGKAKQGYATGVGPDTTERLGFSDYPEDQSATEAFKESLKSGGYISPNGSMFCAKETREGILPMMLKELLATRQMIKRSMKMWSAKSNVGHRVLLRVLDARQLALKMLSNVTYGYISAGYSGRMPMAEVADAIVQCGRSTLDWARDMINGDSHWNAKVLYGDTDSLFVLLRGRSKQEAFRIGREMAARITSLSPASVVLKLEKVYMNVFLISKKRYVGFAYESEDQGMPRLDDKGIETRRRDQCVATQKIQETALRIFFTSKNTDKVRAYLVEQWTKIHVGVGLKLSVADFIFRKEVKLGTYKKESSMPPGAVVAKKKMLVDQYSEPPYGWRVPYLVTWGPPKSALKDNVMSPEDYLMRGSDKRINHIYYITKCVNPSLDRIFRLCNVDISEWYFSTCRPTPRIRHFSYQTVSHLVPDPATVAQVALTNYGVYRSLHQTSMTSYAHNAICEVCGGYSRGYICDKCNSPDLVGQAIVSVVGRLNSASKKQQQLAMICQNCCKFSQEAVIGKHGMGLLIGDNTCSSLDCIVFFERCRLICRIEDLSEAEASVAKSISI